MNALLPSIYIAELKVNQYGEAFVPSFIFYVNVLLAHWYIKRELNTSNCDVEINSSACDIENSAVYVRLRHAARSRNLCRYGNATTLPPLYWRWPTCRCQQRRNVGCCHGNATVCSVWTISELRNISYYSQHYKCQN